MEMCMEMIRKNGNVHRNDMEKLPIFLPVIIRAIKSIRHVKAYE